MNRILSTTAFIAALTALSSPTFAADAPSESSGMSVLLEVRASDDERASAPLAVVLTLIDRHGCAEASEHRRDAEYTFKVCSEVAPGEAPAFSFELNRTRHTSEGSEHRQFKVKAAFTSGKPILIARFSEGARTMEVKATVKRT